MSYVISEIDNETGNVSVTFDYDDIEQTIDCSDYLNSAEGLKDYLGRYEQAYIAGKQVEAAAIEPTPDLDALIGETVTTDTAEE